MKIRTDFVTNSSSSSFIFGVPNGNTVSKESVFNDLKYIANEMLNIVNHLEMIYFQDAKYKKRVLKVRTMGYKYAPENRKKMEDLERSSKSLLCYLRNMSNLMFSVADCYSMFINEYDELESVKKFVKVPNYKTYEKDPIYNFKMLDFRDKKDSDDYFIEEIAYWYLDEILEYDEIRYGDKSLLNYNNLGEIAIASSDLPLPSFMVSYLIEILNYSCNHMG